MWHAMRSRIGKESKKKRKKEQNEKETGQKIPHQLCFLSFFIF